MHVVSVAYPLAPVGQDSVGGAEQVLHALDHALVRAGHRSTVVAAAGSQVADRLVALPPAPARLDAALASAQAAIRAALASLGTEADLVHLHGIDFAAYLPPPGAPVLASLHLPPSWYPAHALSPARPRTWLHCVSPAQHRACPPSAALLPPIENGVAVERFAQRSRRCGFALTLGRICPEKGQHLAIRAARRAGVLLLIAGQVFGYDDHERYYRREIQPRLDNRCRFLGAAGFARKRRLLAAARCLLVPSLAEETSSLVAMEALASGTPVVAFAAGALPDIVEHGRTGFIVRSVEEMADAIGRVDTLDRAACRAAAQARFSHVRMTDAYLARYAALAA